MQNKFTNKLFNSGLTGVKNAAFGYATSSVLGLTATKTLSLGLALSSGAVGAALLLVPAIALRHIAVNNLRIHPKAMFVLDFALTLVGAAIGAYCFGLTLVSMIACMATGFAVTTLVDWLANKVYTALDNHPERTQMHNSGSYTSYRRDTIASSLFGVRNNDNDYEQNVMDGLSYPVGSFKR